MSAWVRQAQARAVALRYHNVYGPRMPRDTPYSGVAAIFRSSIERGEPPQVFEDGGQMRDFVHVGDVARANLAAIEAVAVGDTAPFAAYNVCSGEPVSILDVATMIDSRVTPQVTGSFRRGRRAARGRVPGAGGGRAGFSGGDATRGRPRGVRLRPASLR